MDRIGGIESHPEVLRDYFWQSLGTICNVKDWSRVNCMQDKYLNPYTIYLLQVQFFFLHTFSPFVFINLPPSLILSGGRWKFNLIYLFSFNLCFLYTVPMSEIIWCWCDLLHQVKYLLGPFMLLWTTGLHLNFIAE